MDDMAAYYPPPPGTHYPYYQPPPPQPQPQPQPQVQRQPPPSLTPLPLKYLPPQPTTFATYAAPVVFSPSSHGEVRTLFIAGLPEDVKAREIYHLFREFPGYESSHLRDATDSNQPFAFAVFRDQPSSIAAMYALNGMVFDLEKGSTLYIDLAKSNSRSKRSRSDSERSGLDKRAKVSALDRGTAGSGVRSLHMPGMGNSAHNIIGYPSAPSHGNFGSRAIETSSLHHSSASYVPRNNPPCPTIFVANLGSTCTEQELIQVFSRCRGFLKLKLQGTYGAPVAFVDFQDTASSTEALNHLQGTILYSSPAGDGMRLEYAKSRMGKRRKTK